MAKQQAWTDEATSRLWDHYGSLPDARVPYFGRLAGDSLLEFAKLAGILSGQVLDYGAGPGHVTRKIAERGYDVSAIEFSPKSKAKLEANVGPNPRLKAVYAVEGLPTPPADGSFDLVVCSEVVEHLTDAWLAPTLTELYRLTKPGGHVLISTPHAETLEDNFVYCPFCDSEHHRWQHVRSFTAPALSEAGKAAGFEIAFCQGIHLARFIDVHRLLPLRQLSASRLADWLIFQGIRASDGFGARQFGRAFRYLTRQVGPHLLCVGRKG